jgi:AraC family transcriptional regulator
MVQDKLIEKALRYIERNLKGELHLEDIAAEANYSAWHFHRLFFAATGFTVGEYIRKRRLSEASREVVHTARPIRQIAADYRFESVAAFTRSMKNHCGSTPGRLRDEVRNLPCYQPRIRIRKKGEPMLTPRIEHKDSFRVIGLSCRSTMRNNTIHALWDDFNKVCGDLPFPVKPGAALGVCFYEEVEEMTDDTPFTYLAGMETEPDQEPPTGYVKRDVPAAEYAVFEHKGSLDTLQETYAAIY